MEAVNTKIDSIIQLGRSWGMSDEDISQCLLAGSQQSGKISENSQPSHSPAGQVLSWIVFLVKWTVYIFVISILLMILLYAIVGFIMGLSFEAEMKIQAIVTPYIYPAMRLARIGLKPIADYFDLTGLYSAECVVFNPFYTEGVPDCQTCQGVKEFKLPDIDDPKSIPTLLSGVTPFLFEVYTAPTTFATMRDLYHENEHRFGPGMHVMKTNIPSVTTISDVMNMSEHEFVETAGGLGRVVWQTGGVAAAQAIRKLFPRPYFLPSEAEVSLSKTMVFSGPHAPPFEFGQEAFAMIWYIQASGSNNVTLFPHPDCMAECDIVEDVLREGDLIFLQDQFWRLSISASGIEEDWDKLSIGFLSSFTF